MAIKARQEFLQTKEDIIKAQAAVRMLLAMEKLKEAKEAATRIQAFARQKVNLKRKYLEAYRAAILLQSAVSAPNKQEFKAMQAAAIKIQAETRKFLAQQQLARENAAAIAIQASGLRTRKQLEALEKTITKVQAKFDKARAEYLALRAATIKAQSAVRMHLAAKKFKEAQLAATAIQANIRKFTSSRKNVSNCIRCSCQSSSCCKRGIS